MADESEEKSQEPTEKKKREAREEGQVLTSREGFVFVSIVSGAGLLSLSTLLGPAMLARWTDYFRLSGTGSLDSLIVSRLSQFWTEVLLIGLGFAVPIGLALIAFQISLGGINFSAKSFRFNPGKIDPIKGFGRMFSTQSLLELGKGVLKVTGLGAIAGLSLRSDLTHFAALSGLETSVGLSLLWSAMLSLLFWLCLGLAVIGGIDLAAQIFFLRQKLMMSVQEVKEESKESNGSPEVKGRLRRLQMEASQKGQQQRAALADVPKATAIVTNPTHFAVALRYVPGETRAPVVLAMGKGPLAQEIMSIGRSNSVQVMQSPQLARALYFTGDIGQEIIEGLFGPVAAVLAHVYRLDRGQASDLPDVDLPDELMFNEFGNRNSGGANA